ncbi:MAG TPA: nodulation protein NfeD [Gammaproteobacteria bacterium]|nr:nodulation protein NfeD [Gammaproteobacteria bacterium]
MTINRWLRRGLSVALLTALGTVSWLQAQETQRSTAASIRLLSVRDAISPATSDYIVRGIEEAAASNAPLVIIELDTPGGLDSSMRDIIQAILGADVPVVTYVSPAGARAASAGTYILYASHVAAMAEATNTGAATPVAIGGSSPIGGTPADNETEDDSTIASDEGSDEPAPADSAPEPGSASERKAVNDAVAYIRSLAEQRNRNADWAERAVRSGASISAAAALENNVIDIVAVDLPDLLRQLDGWQVSVNGRSYTLATQGLAIERIEPDWRTQFLAVISNPTVAYMLMLLGIYGLLFEGYNPGAIVPGVVGSIALLLALFAFQVLPVDYAGLALILLGIILMIAEFLVPSFGALGIGGIAAFVFGSVILIDTDVPGFGVSRTLIGSIATIAAGLLLGLIWLAMKSRARPVVSGAEQLAQSLGEALEDFDGEGAVWAHGERWRAVSSAPVHKGQKVRILRIEGLVLHVEPA